MARKYMTKEVAITTIKVAEMKVNENGLPVVEQLPDVTVIGSLDIGKARDHVSRNMSPTVQAYAVETVTQTYKMKVSDFIRLAELVTPDDTSVNEEDTDEHQEEKDVESK